MVAVSANTNTNARVRLAKRRGTRVAGARPLLGVVDTNAQLSVDIKGIWRHAHASCRESCYLLQREVLRRSCVRAMVRMVVRVMPFNFLHAPGAS